jgi:hypothetical protein
MPSAWEGKYGDRIAPKTRTRSEKGLEAGIREAAPCVVSVAALSGTSIAVPYVEFQRDE